MLFSKLIWYLIRKSTKPRVKRTLMVTKTRFLLFLTSLLHRSLIFNQFKCWNHWSCRLTQHILQTYYNCSPPYFFIFFLLTAWFRRWNSNSYQLSLPHQASLLFAFTLLLSYLEYSFVVKSFCWFYSNQGTYSICPSELKVLNLFGFEYPFMFVVDRLIPKTI